MYPTVEDVLQYLTDAYPNIKVRPATLCVIKDALADAPGRFLMEAAERHVLHSKWFPSVAELRQQLEHVRQKREALADVLRHERLARHRQVVEERPYPPIRDPRCLRMSIYYTDDELFEMEVAQGTIPDAEARAERDEEIDRILPELRKKFRVTR